MQLASFLHIGKKYYIVEQHQGPLSLKRYNLFVANEMHKRPSGIKSLLVADDDLDDLMLLLSAIKTIKKDVIVSHVQDGAQLLEFLRLETAPDLILLDINMPKIDGIDCLKAIKSNVTFGLTPIVMYSTTSNRETIDKCYQFGASRYMIKPFFYKDIVRFVKMLLSMDWNKTNTVSKEKFILNGEPR